MRKETKRFVEYWTPGIMFGEEWREETETLDPDKIKWPDNAYAFRLYEREDVIDGEKRYKGEDRQVGPMYYHPDSRVETLEEVKGNPDATKTLISNMEINGWDRIAWTRWGNWPQPFDPEKVVVLGKKKPAEGRANEEGLRVR